MSGGSLSFDRAAAYYDSTRVTDPDALKETVDALADLLTGPVLEIGVGTGALALPFAKRGRRLVGIDLSAAMLAKLRDKAGTDLPITLLRADATRLPFAGASFGGAYARWVLHLIPGWRDVVAELCRVVQPGGTVAVEPGGYRGVWAEVWLRFLEELGEQVAPRGLDAVRRHEVLQEAFESQGAEIQATLPISHEVSASLAGFFSEVERKMYSWTWDVPDPELAAGVAAVRSWAEARYGDLTVTVPEMTTRWRAFRVRP